MDEKTKLIHIEYPGGISAYINLTTKELAELEKVIKENPKLEPWECLKLIRNNNKQ